MTTTPPFNWVGAAINCAAPADITSTTEAAFRAQIENTIAAAPSGWRFLRIDLKSTRLIDSKGLNLIVSLSKSLRSGDHEIQLVGPQPHILRILSFTRLDRHIAVVNADGSPV